MPMALEERLFGWLVGSFIQMMYPEFGSNIDSGSELTHLSIYKDCSTLFWKLNSPMYALHDYILQFWEVDCHGLSRLSDKG